jgi:hypothetical protein
MTNLNDFKMVINLALNQVINETQNDFNFIKKLDCSGFNGSNYDQKQGNTPSYRDLWRYQFRFLVQKILLKNT